jgi:hypothetical protein
MREGQTAWTPRPRWAYGEDVSRRANGYGFRRATFRGQPVLEVGYGLGEYARVGDVLAIGSSAR